MNNITITEKYALCMLKERGKLYGNELTPHILISMIIEMMLEENLQITDKNKVKLNEQEPQKEYNKKLFDMIKNMKKEEVPAKDIINYICYNFTDKKAKSIIELLKVDMLNDKLITLETKKGLLGEKETISVNETIFNQTIEELRAELLEKGTLPEDLILLGALLDSTKFLKNIFNKYEQETIKNRLDEIHNSDIAKKVKIAQKVIDDMNTVIIISTAIN